MKRSEINNIMRCADSFIRERGFYLPPFAYWNIDEWKNRKAAAAEIVENGLGWDITDFGSGNFDKEGLFLFTLRNGKPDNWKSQKGKLYAEKLMIVEKGQITPMHFHWSKMEDIINRGGGRLVIRLYNATADEDLDNNSPVRVSTDGILREIQPGGTVTLGPGESITLLQRCYHEFWGAEKRTLVGEVSMVNDDRSDNRFYKQVGRFPEIEEDEDPLHLLVGDYSRFLN